MVFGAVRACRRSSVEGADSIPGLFINTLPVRITVRNEQPVLAWLEQIRQEWIELRDYEHNPLALIQSWSGAPGGSPLFESLLNVQDPAWDAQLRAQGGEWAGRQFRMVNQPGYPLALDVYGGRTLAVKAFYSRMSFDEGTITRLLGHLRIILECIAANPQQKVSEVPLLTGAEGQQLLVDWNRTEGEYPKQTCIHQLFEAQAEQSPDALAVVDGQNRLTYQELNQRSNHLANELRRMGVGPDARVGICAERSVELVLGELAVLKAGGAFVPIDPGYPMERIHWLLEDAAISILLTQQKLIEKLPNTARLICLDDSLQSPINPNDSLNPASGVASSNLAYVIYTSGSTGRPKGVEVHHAGLVNLVAWHQRAYQITRADRATQLASPAFDASVWEVWPYLTAGASLHVAGPEIPLASKSLLPWLAAEKITICFLATPLAEALMDEAWPTDIALRALLTGGDRLHRWPGKLFPCPLFNHYGPTENTVVTTFGLVDGSPGGSNSPPIGRPIANTQIYILDRQLRPVPIGVAGELHIGGVGLARGYLNRPELTAEKFIQNPFSQESMARLYKTGDKARYLANGTIEFLGRLDQQVKIRGLRIEPGEIESVLSQHPAVREAAVIAREDIPEDKRLVAYVVFREQFSNSQPGQPSAARPHGSANPEMEEVRQHLRSKLPEYMVPSAFVFLDRLPLTPNGKIDHKALPKPDLDAVSQNGFVAPRTPTEEMLAGIWSEVLQVPEVGIEHNFFHLGGHSLRAAQALARARSAFEVDLGMQDFFEHPTVTALAAKIDNLTTQAKPRTSNGNRGADCHSGKFVKIENKKPEGLPLSFGQERLWFLEQLQPGQPLHNIPASVRIEGDLDVAALQQSLHEILRRHEVLRMSFTSEKGRPAATLSNIDLLPMPVIDLREIPQQEREADARRLAQNEAMQPFALGRAPLLRAKLLRFDEKEHWLLLTTHHMICDGWSLGVFYRDLSVLYDAFRQKCAPALPELHLDYPGFVSRQRELLRPAMLEKQLAYWEEKLKGPLPTLDLPADRPRPPIQTYRGETQFFALPSSLCAGLRKLSRREDVTLFMLLLAAFQALLNRYTGQEDILLGTPIAGRHWADTENLMGLFLNTLVLRTSLAGEPTFRELLRRVRKTALEAYAHQDVPFEKIVEALPLTRDLSRSPLFQIMFALQNAPVQSAALGDLRLTPLPLGNGASKFDLTLFVEDDGKDLRGSVEFNTDLFDSQTIVRLLGHWQTLLETIVEDPNQQLSRLPILTENERRQVLVEWNQTQVEYRRDRCVHELFEEQVERTPDAIAAVFEDEELSYSELNNRANCLARHLQSLGVSPETRVGICFGRSLEMLIGLLGILKAGGCYVPLDPVYPKERLAFMLEDSQAPVLLTEKKLARDFTLEGLKVVVFSELELSQNDSTARPQKKTVQSGATPDNAAYVIYTSGSTGKPKGVMVCHRNVANFFTAMDGIVGKESGVWLAITSICFDISVLELFWTLTRGFKVVIQGDEGGFRAAPAPRPSHGRFDLSLFYFASDAAGKSNDKYKLLLEGAKFADQNGLAAVWTPERHFHPFGGLYPNPAVTSAALAMITNRVQLRAGSVVLPLQDPLKVVEQWSVVDQLSKGRTALSFTSGWHPNDFVLAPHAFSRRKELLLEHLETVRKLWRGESVQRPNSSGELVEVQVFPKPIQPELPVWLTSSGNIETFRTAAEIGANVLTHLSGQNLEQLAKKIELYRSICRSRRPSQPAGRVSLMLHTFLWDKAEFVREKVRQPLCEYLRTYRGLSEGHPAHQNADAKARDSKEVEAQIEAMLNNAVDRYLESCGLFGTPETCLQTIQNLKTIGVDEVACLVDFGVETDLVLASFKHLTAVQEQSQPKPQPRRPHYTVAEQLARHRVTHLQCTPSLAGMLIQDPQAHRGLHSLKKLLLGGEALPASLVKQLGIPGEILNMYGPTETTVWSAAEAVTEADGPIPIGRPVANTEIYILDRHFQPVPAGIPGEILIGGAGVTRGYLNRAELTADKFIVHPFSQRPGARLYRTGDLGRFLADGKIEFLGRLDHQVKLRGFRIELGEIEAALCAHPQVREAVAVLREFSAGDQRLVAYIVPQSESKAAPAELRSHLKGKLPDYMIPSVIESLDRLPLTPNGKVDRKALPEPAAIRAAQPAAFAPVQTRLEQRIAAIWQKLLHVEQIGLDDNFFDLGGHSLLVTQVHSELSAEVQGELSILKLFQYPTIRSLAKFLNQEQKQQVSFQKIRDRARLQKGAFGEQRHSREVSV